MLQQAPQTHNKGVPAANSSQPIDQLKPEPKVHEFQNRNKSEGIKCTSSDSQHSALWDNENEFVNKKLRSKSNLGKLASCTQASTLIPAFLTAADNNHA